MDYVDPGTAAQSLAVAAGQKVSDPPVLSIGRSVLAAAILSLAVTFACLTTAETHLTVAGALVFPVGLATIIVLGLELFTATSAFAFVAVAAGTASVYHGVRASLLVYAGNLVGSLLLGVLLWSSFSMLGQSHDPLPPFATRLCEVATAKVKYAQYGLAGLSAAFIKGVLCNFMLCAAVALASLTRSFAGKILAAWTVAIVFFGLGLEHSIINMFVIPVAMLFGAQISTHNFLLFNLLPVTLGNTLGGALILLPFYWLNTRAKPTQPTP